MLQYLNTHDPRLEFRYVRELGYSIYADTDGRDFETFTLSDLNEILEYYDSGLVAHLRDNSSVGERKFPVVDDICVSKLLYDEMYSFFKGTHTEVERERVLSELLLLPVCGSVLDTFSTYRAYILYICNFFKSRSDLVEPITRYNNYCRNFIPLTTCTLSRAFKLIDIPNEGALTPEVISGLLLKRVECMETEDIIVRFSDRRKRFFKISDEMQSILDLNLNSDELKLLLSVKNLFVNVEWVMKYFSGLSEYIIYLRDTFKVYGELTAKSFEVAELNVQKFPSVQQVLGKLCRKNNLIMALGGNLKPEKRLWASYFKKKYVERVLREGNNKLLRKNLYLNAISELEKMNSLKMSDFELECLFYLLDVRFNNFILSDLFVSTYDFLSFLIDYLKNLHNTDNKVKL